LGAFTKSAQFPFHFWLPGAMAAPTPVSAYLHSATMVKAGVYLLARLSPMLAGTDLWFYIVTTIGTITMLVGVWALFKTDLKQILAYSTISALGTLVMLLGLGTEDGIKAAMVFLIVHALYKGALFLVAGAVDHETGTRDITRLRGLGKVMPIIAGAAGLAALSMAGVPPWLGFIGKELIYEANLHAPMLANLLTGSAVAANMIMVAVAGIVGYHVFFGPVTETARRGHEAPLLMWTAPLLLAGLGLLTGLVPGLIAKPLITPAVQAVLAEPIETKLALWHGVNPALILSGVTLLGGWLIYMGRNWLRNGADRLMIFEKIGPKELYEQGLRGLDNLAAWQTRILQAGYLRYYVIIIVLTTIALVGSTLIVKYGLFINTDLSDVRPYELALAVVMLLAAWVAVTSSSRLAVVSALSVVGYGLTLNYILFGAPDLAMTQISIDTLTLILLVLILYRLPRFLSYTPKKDRRRDMVISLAAGALMTLLVLTVVNVPTDSKLTPYFAANSYDLAKGRNVVNVILVDFRGFDTLGEITVLTVAAAGVFALLRSGASDPKKDEAVDR
jgi:multicomponent Na+:H+ antiporter subunit A